MLLPYLIAAAFLLLATLALAPIAQFLLKGWQRRKDRLLNDFDGPSARTYLRTYHSTDWVHWQLSEDSRNGIDTNIKTIQTKFDAWKTGSTVKELVAEVIDSNPKLSDGDLDYFDFARLTDRLHDFIVRQGDHKKAVARFNVLVAKENLPQPLVEASWKTLRKEIVKLDVSAESAEQTLVGWKASMDRLRDKRGASGELQPLEVMKYFDALQAAAQAVIDALHADAIKDAAKDLREKAAKVRDCSDKYAVEKLEAHYDSTFSKKSFWTSGTVFLLSLTFLLFYAALSLIHQVPSPLPEMPDVVILALAGGYMWVVYDLISKASNDLLLPRDIYWATFRLVISVPLGCAVSDGLLGISNGIYRVPVAFFLGAFPTRSLFTIMRRFVANAVTWFSAAESGKESELQKLPGVDQPKAEILADEGVTSIHELANYDPVRLAIRTGLPFGYIVGIIGDALLWTYLQTAEKATLFRECGLSGAYDCALLYDYYDDPRESWQMYAKKIIKHLADKMVVPFEGVQNLIWNVAKDPTTKFIYYAWRWNIR